MLQKYIAELYCGGISRQIYSGRYIMADILPQLYYGRYIMADILRQIYHGRHITAIILKHIYLHIYIYITTDIYYGRYIMADILRQIHYGRYIAFNKNKHINQYSAPEAVDCCIQVCSLQRIVPRTHLDHFICTRRDQTPF